AVVRVRTGPGRGPAVGAVRVVARSGDTVLVEGEPAADPARMVRAAERVESQLPARYAHLTGTAAMWADFNHANKKAMLRSELLSWPLTLALLALAFGSPAPARLPLLLPIPQLP